MKKKINEIYTGSDNRKGLYDLFVSSAGKKKPVVVFVHGYMGYKDWGAWDLFAEAIQKSGVSVAKLNLTHNGTTLSEHTAFADLEAFGNGGCLKELQDVRLFLDHLEKEHQFSEFILVGHSRGGGIVLLVGKDERVKQIHCLAPICDIASRFPSGEQLEEWKNTNVYYRKNGRTGQELPHYYSQYEDFLRAKDSLDIEKTCRQLNKPVFVYHGNNDASVLPVEGEKVAEWTGGKFYLIENTAHTFDTSEPWKEAVLPGKMQEVIELMTGNIRKAAE